MWMSSLRPDQIHFQTECCTATTKREKKEMEHPGYWHRSRKEVWEFVDVVSGIPLRRLKIPKQLANVGLTT